MEKNDGTKYFSAYDILEGQIRVCYGRAVYSHKTHEKCADILLRSLSRIKILQILLSAITTGSFIVIIFGSEKIGTIVGVVLSTILLYVNIYTKNYNLDEIAQKHKQAASDIWFIREEYLSLITDLRIGDKKIEELQIRRDGLLSTLHDVYAGSPSTTSAAYQKAQYALQRNEEMTFSDQEIDAFLPKELRRRPMSN